MGARVRPRASGLRPDAPDPVRVRPPPPAIEASPQGEPAALPGTPSSPAPVRSLPRARYRGTPRSRACRDSARAAPPVRSISARMRARSTSRSMTPSSGRNSSPPERSTVCAPAPSVPPVLAPAATRSTPDRPARRPMLSSSSAIADRSACEASVTRICTRVPGATPYSARSVLTAPTNSRRASIAASASGSIQSSGKAGHGPATSESAGSASGSRAAIASVTKGTIG